MFFLEEDSDQVVKEPVNFIGPRRFVLERVFSRKSKKAEVFS
jgi:hypothetical protein